MRGAPLTFYLLLSILLSLKAPAVCYLHFQCVCYEIRLGGLRLSLDDYTILIVCGVLLAVSCVVHIRHGFLFLLSIHVRGFTALFFFSLN
jgi:hypothetical protein